MLALARLIDRLTLGSGAVAAILIFPLIFATCWEVFARYLLGAPTIWAFELGYMGMGAHFILGGAYTLKRQGHIRIDLIYERLRPKTRALFDLVGHLFLMLPFSVWLSFGLWEFFLEGWTFNERSGQSAWNPVVWPFRLVLFAGFALLAMQLISEVLKSLAVLLGECECLEDID